MCKSQANADTGSARSSSSPATTERHTTATPRSSETPTHKTSFLELAAAPGAIAVHEANGLPVDLAFLSLLLTRESGLE